MSSPAKIRAAEILEHLSAELGDDELGQATRTLEAAVAIGLLLLALVESLDELGTDIANRG